MCNDGEIEFKNTCYNNDISNLSSYTMIDLGFRL